MNILMTGAAGFLGAALTRRLQAEPGVTRVLLTDRDRPEVPADRRFAATQADLTDPAARRDLLAGVDRVLHLAAVPGGAAEADPAASRRVNLEATLDLAEEIAEQGSATRLVYASSIAVFGAPLPARIDDATPAHPIMTYGAHKLMVEIALADLVRRRRLDALALRLPGLAARPRAAQGLQSAFISEIFHAVPAGEAYVVPMRAAATVWLMSVARAAENMLHAAKMRTPTDSTPRVMTLPALRVRVADLVTELVEQSGSPSRILYAPEPALEAQFGALPPLATPLADTLGFSHDGDLARLVRTVREDLARSAAG